MAERLRPENTPIGIDLGTTLSVVAFIDDAGRPSIIPNEQGEYLTPSAVLIQDGEITVGRDAVRQAAMHPKGYADCFKRNIGEREYRQKINGVAVPPEVLSGFVLHYLKSFAERRLGGFGGAVVTVPAFFDEVRRQSTYEAARLADLKVLDLINEPTAAAIAYALETGILDPDTGFRQEENLLVYDLGGGTFDVTVLHVEGWTMRALATDGDVRLGGRDCDERIVGYIADRFLAEHGVDPRVDLAECARLWIEAEQVKHMLSTRSQVKLDVQYAGLRLPLTITREIFEELVADLIGRTESTLRQVLQAAALEWGDVGRVLLVGGATRMPVVSEMIHRLIGKPPEATLSPDEAVAKGAAIYAGMLMKLGGRTTPSRLRLVNVNSHSLGVVGRDVKTKRLVNSILIPRNTPLPATARRAFPLARKHQQRVTISIIEGEARKPEDCVQLGKCDIDDLPSNPPEDTKVVVEYTIDSSGLITVSAGIPGVRRGVRLQIDRGIAPECQSLDEWCRRLSGQADTHDDTDDVVQGSPESLVKELDDRFIRLGQLAMLHTLSGRAAAEKKNAVRTLRACEQAQRELTVCEKRHSDAANQPERIMATSDVARSRATIRELEQQYRFQLLSLGRLVSSDNLCLPEADEIIGEISRIQEAFSKCQP